MGTLSDVGRCYEFNAEMLAGLTRGFSESDWELREDTLNAAHWILAHIVRTRRSVLRMLGHNVPVESWEEVTGMGGPREGFRQAPAVPDLLEEFRTQGLSIKENLISLAPETASRPLEAELPDGSKTVEEGICGFFFLHECYHLGQLGMIRRLLGKPGIV